MLNFQDKITLNRGLFTYNITPKMFKDLAFDELHFHILKAKPKNALPYPYEMYDRYEEIILKAKLDYSPYFKFDKNYK